METKTPNDDTNYSNLGIEGESDLKQRLNPSDSVKAIAYETSEWASKYGTITVLDNDEVVVYRDGLWETAGEQALCEILRDAVCEEFTPNLLRHVKNQLRGIGLTNRSQFGSSPSEVAVNNGLLEINNQDGESGLRNLRPHDHIKWCLPVNYQPNADCPLFKRILRQLVPDKGERLKLQEYVGYALDDSTAKFEKMLLLLGPTDTGKTVFLDVIEELFGTDNVANQSIQFLANQRWGVDKIADKPVNIRHDLDSRSIKRVSMVKELASGNPIKAEKKGGDPYEVRPTAKHFFSANQVPGRKNPDDAFYNRWLTVMFTQQVPKDEQDSDLSEKLATRDELSGILNWAIDGYERLHWQGHFTGERPPNEIRTLWEKKGGSIDRFINKHVEVVMDNDAHVFKEIMYAAYCEFVEDHGTSPESQNMLTRKLNAIDGIQSGQRRFDGSPKSTYIGVKLRDF